MDGPKHTPGPWTIEDDSIEASGAPICVLYDASDFPCWDGPAGQLEAECEANARLIAAAPELLAACELAAEVLEQPESGGQAHAHAALTVAIAKAKGGA